MTVDGNGKVKIMNDELENEKMFTFLGIFYQPRSEQDKRETLVTMAEEERSRSKLEDQSEVWKSILMDSCSVWL